MLGAMKKILLPGAQTTPEEILSAFPESSRIFNLYHTDCVGCYLARFCTLEEMAALYRIDLASFLRDLRQQYAQSIPTSKGVNHEQV